MFTSDTKLYEVRVYTAIDDLWPRQYIVNAWDSTHAEKIIINMLELAIDFTGNYALPDGYKIQSCDATWQLDCLTSVYEFSTMHKHKGE